MDRKETTPCRACTIAAARIAATHARVRFDRTTYWADPKTESTFLPVIEAARHAYRRAHAILDGKASSVLHTCDGYPERCERCGTPLVGAGMPCTNLLCGALFGERDIQIACGPLHPMDHIGPTDVAIAWQEVTYSHLGGESRWPCVVFVTLDGNIYHASGMRPTTLTDAEIACLPSRSREYVQVSDRSLGTTQGRALTSFNDESYRDTGISWYEAYERPETGERFKVYDYDHE